jgi:hypothetical protein
MTKDQIELLYNGCYGGWGISTEAYNLYNLKMLEKDSSFEPLDKQYKCSFENNIERHNPILVQIYHEIGKKMNDTYSKICVKTIPKKYENYYIITEYDGIESVVINHIQYEYDTFKSTLKEILIDDTILSDAKINKLIKMLDL